MLALVPTVLSLFAVAAPPTITPAEASKHVGEEVIVQGTIDQIVSTVNLTTHINFGGRYPNHVFTATILKAKQPLFTRVRDYEGKVAQVRGVVRLYRGKPEIMLNEPSQLSLPGSPPAAPASGDTPGEAPSPAVAALRFDSQGVDFGAWVSHFNAAVNPTATPEAGLSSSAGLNADFEFVIERDGSISAIRMLKSSGRSTLDRAAAKALTNGRYLPLPEAYPEANLMVQATVVFAEAKK